MHGSYAGDDGIGSYPMLLNMPGFHHFFYKDENKQGRQANDEDVKKDQGYRLKILSE